jgi:hypothetical protein
VGLGAIVASAVLGLWAGGGSACVLCLVSQGVSRLRDGAVDASARGNHQVASAASGATAGKPEWQLRYALHRFEAIADGDEGPGGPGAPGAAAAPWSPQLDAVLRVNGGVLRRVEVPGVDDREPRGRAFVLAPGVQLALAPRWALDLCCQVARFDLGGKQAAEPPGAAVAVTYRF